METRDDQTGHCLASLISCTESGMWAYWITMKASTTSYMRTVWPGLTCGSWFDGHFGSTNPLVWLTAGMGWPLNDNWQELQCPQILGSRTSLSKSMLHSYCLHWFIISIRKTLFCLFYLQPSLKTLLQWLVSTGFLLLVSVILFVLEYLTFYKYKIFIL